MQERAHSIDTHSESQRARGRILHVTESMAAGTMQVIIQLACAQAADGYEVLVAHSIRPDTPDSQTLERCFPQPISRVVIPMTTAPSLLSDWKAYRGLAAVIRDFRPDVVHLHSSKAGAIGRVVCKLIGHRRVFYSPHGFAFLRADVSSFARWIYLAAEQLLARLCGTVVTCSASEASLARQTVKARRVALVENAIDIGVLPSAKCRRTGRLRIVTSGRLTYQKAPWRFYELAARHTHDPVDFVWIGGPSCNGDEVKFAPPENVKVTGWVDRPEVLLLLADADIYVLLSLWEGMPLVLIEAQALGLPAIVSNVVGSKDVVRNSVTGFVCTDDAEVSERLTQLLTDGELRRTMGANARTGARDRFNSHRMHTEMLSVYGFTPDPYTSGAAT